MYATIEADIENGVIRSTEASRLPMHAHVLITLLSVSQDTLSNTNSDDASTTKTRWPHSEIRGKIKVRGNIMDTVPTSSWDLTK
jgi:hypothetical protein